MFGARSSLWRYSKRFVNLHHRRSFCNNSTSSNNSSSSSNNKNPQNVVNGGNNDGNYDKWYLDAYRDLDKLNFTRAAEIMFSTPRRKRKFGLDFHLVQLFFALMPSFAVYLVAKYSRYEMKRMEAELELKKKAQEEKKAEEEMKAKQMEAAAAAEKEPETNPELLKVKERLEALEETVKEIAVVAKTQLSDDKSRSAGQSQEKVDAKRKSEDKHESDKNQTLDKAAVQPTEQGRDSKGSQENEKK